MKIVIPLIEAKNGGALYTLVDDLANTNSQVTKEPLGVDLVINDAAADASHKIVLDQATLLSILATGGEVSEYLMAIRATNAIVNDPVPEGLPIRKDAGDNIKTFIQWFLPGAEIWDEDASTGIIFYTNPAAGLASPSDYLTGSQMEIIRQLDTVNYSILTTSDADEITAAGWTKHAW